MNEFPQRKPGRPPATAQAIEKAVEYIPDARPIMAHTCPKCGKGQDPEVLQTVPDKNMYKVRCRACAAVYQFKPATTRIIL